MPTDDGSEIRAPDERESKLLTEGLLPSEVLLPKARPEEVEHLGRFTMTTFAIATEDALSEAVAETLLHQVRRSGHSRPHA